MIVDKNDPRRYTLSPEEHEQAKRSRLLRALEASLVRVDVETGGNEFEVLSVQYRPAEVLKEAWQDADKLHKENVELRKLLEWCFERITADGLPDSAWSEGTYASRIRELLGQQREKESSQA